MMRRPPIRALVVSLVLALATVSCEHTGQLGPVTDDSRALLTSSSSSSEEWTLLEDRIPSDILDLEVSKLIGVGGGQLSLAGHSLAVPAGAVQVPTLFTLTVKTNGLVEVDLTATVSTLLGVLNIGAQGFEKPVTVTLTYARSPNAPEDPSGITVLHRLGKNKFEAIPTTVNATQKTATAELDHFSGYLLGDN